MIRLGVMSPAPDLRKGSRRASSQFTVVCHPDLLEAAQAKAEAEHVTLSEAVRELVARWANYDGPQVVGRSDRV